MSELNAKDAAVYYLLSAGLTGKAIEKLRGIGYFDARCSQGEPFMRMDDVAEWFKSNVH